MPHQSTRIARACAQCGAPFTAYPSRVKKGDARYCSRRCGYDAMIKPGKPCAQCGRIFKSWQKRARLCSHACRDASMRVSLEDRLWRGVTKGEGCWLRLQSLDPDGYSRVSGKPERHFIRAHRLAYELTYGPIPDGLVVRHLCPGGGNPACIRPDHLAVGTQADNVADRVAAGHNANGVRNGSYSQPERRRRGEEHGCARLTENDVRQIRLARAQGALLRDIASAFGTSQTNVSSICRRRIWQHVR